MPNIETQRLRDGAFFEDWSQWRKLGGWPQWRQCHPAVGKRRTGMPHYYLDLHERAVLLDGKPGFEIGVPHLASIYKLLTAIPGAREWPDRMTAQRGIKVWSVPAEEWQRLRAALPGMVRSIEQMMSR